MKAQIISTQFDKNAYNKVAMHPMQSWEWGNARQKMSIDVVRIGLFDDNQLEAVFQTTFHPIPKTKFTVGYLPRSVVPPYEVLQLLKEEGKKRNAIFIKIEPYLEVNSEHSGGNKLNIIQTKNRKDLLHYERNTSLSGHPLFPEWTQVLNLEPSVEKLLANMKPKTRYNVRLAQKKGVDVKKLDTSEGFDTFADLYFQTTKRQNYRGHTKSYHQIIFETLKDAISHIYIAYLGDVPLAAYHMAFFNKRAYYMYGGSSLESKASMAPHALMWQVIQDAKAAGCVELDMWGSLPPNYDQNDPWAGFTRFKEGFGTRFAQLEPGRDLVLSRSLYVFYAIAQKLRTKFHL